MIEVTNTIKEIVVRIVICEHIEESFKGEGRMEHIYRGKSEGFKESLEYMGLSYEQIIYLVQIERNFREKGGGVIE